MYVKKCWSSIAGSVVFRCRCLRYHLLCYFVIFIFINHLILVMSVLVIYRYTILPNRGVVHHHLLCIFLRCLYNDKRSELRTFLHEIVHENTNSTSSECIPHLNWKLGPLWVPKVAATRERSVAQTEPFSSVTPVANRCSCAYIDDFSPILSPLMGHANIVISAMWSVLRIRVISETQCCNVEAKWRI